MLLSIAMMVKNEERFLERTLKALIPIKDDISCEIVVVDTGSEDNTVNIAKKYADKVVVELWKNNFADMRNISISHCSGEWVLVVDADEVLENPKGITEFFTRKLNKKYNAAAVAIKNITSDDDRNYIMGSLVRMFKKDSSLRYEGKIHEQPKYNGPVLKSNAIFKHYGYNNNDYKLMIYKYERNLKLLEEELRQTPNDIYIIFQLAQTYSMAKKMKESLEFIRRAYELCENKKDGLDENLYVYHFYAKELYAINENNKVIEICEKVLKSKKGYLDFYYLLGNSYERIGNIKKAVEFYEEYLNIRNNYENHEGFKTSSVIDFSHSRNDEILINLFKIRFNEMNYKECINLYKQIEDKNIIKSMESPFVVAMIMESNEGEIIKFIDEKIIDDDFIENVVMALEKVSLMKELEKEKIEWFRNKNKFLDLAINATYDEDISFKANEIKYTKFYLWKVNLLINLIKKDKTNILLLNESNRIERIRYISNIIKDYEVVDKVVGFLEENKLTSKIEKLQLLIDIEGELLKNDILSEEKYEKLIYLFLTHNINKINYIYNMKNISYEKINYLSDEQDIVSFKLIHAFNLYEEDKIEFIKILRNIVQDYSGYRNIINFLRKLNLESKITEDMIKEKYNLIKVIEEIVQKGEIQKAKEIVDHLYGIFKFDIDVLNTYGTIYYMIGEFDEALEKLNLAYILNFKKFDTLYNIANVFESINKYGEALYYYENALVNCNENEMCDYIQNKINNIEKD